MPLFVNSNTDDDGHDEHGHDEFMNAIGKIAVVISVMYCFWVFETLVCLLGKANHSHNHVMPVDRMTEESSVCDDEVCDDEKHDHDDYDQDAF